MTKIDSLRRFLLPCLSPSTTTASPVAAPAKKRLSTSLIDDDPQPQDRCPSPILSPPPAPAPAAAPQRPSKTMVIGTIFGPKNNAAGKGHVWFCVQHDRVSLRPILLLELSIPTLRLAREMQSSGLVRIALESRSSPDFATCPLRSVPEWTVSVNGKTLGFAVRRKVCDRTRLMLRTMESMTVGAGVFPAGSEGEEVMYMRANYEHVVGSSDSESFHLINPDESHGQELSIFLLRSTR